MELTKEGLVRLRRKLFLKYLLDRMLAVALLLLASPIFLAVACFIKVDGLLNRENAGPVFYTEPRLSEGRRFNIIKFRTAPMWKVDWIKEEPESRSMAQTAETTRAGGLVLKWYLDELAQMINIVRGQMSFVGPRPHIASLDRKERDLGFGIRHAVKAGLLGLAVLHKRDPSFRKMFHEMTSQEPQIRLLELDRAYVQTCIEKSALGLLLFDWLLIARGLLVVLRGTR